MNYRAFITVLACYAIFALLLVKQVNSFIKYYSSKKVILFIEVLQYMSLVLRKPVFGVSDQVPHKPGCTTTEDG